MARRRKQSDGKMRKEIEPTGRDLLAMMIAFVFMIPIPSLAKSSELQLILWLVCLGLSSGSLLLLFILFSVHWTPVRFIRALISPVHIQAMLRLTTLGTIGVGFLRSVLLHWERFRDRICIASVVFVLIAYPLWLGIVFLWQKGVKKLTLWKSKSDEPSTSSSGSSFGLSRLFAPQVASDHASSTSSTTSSESTFGLTWLFSPQVLADESSTSSTGSGDRPSTSSSASSLGLSSLFASQVTANQPQLDQSDSSQIAIAQPPVAPPQSSQIPQPSQISELSKIADEISNLSQIAGEISELSKIAGEISKLSKIASEISKLSEIADHISELSKIACKIAQPGEIALSKPLQIVID